MVRPPLSSKTTVVGFRILRFAPPHRPRKHVSVVLSRVRTVVLYVFRGIANETPAQRRLQVFVQSAFRFLADLGPENPLPPEHF